MVRSGSAEKASPPYEFLLVGAGFWMLTGLFLDGWAHSNQKPDSFFTPWHAVLYSGFGAACLVVAAQTRSRTPQGDWVERLHKADRVSLAGLALFAFGAVADLAWHQAFGIEVNIDALLSPTHLLLLSGALLALSGPLRATRSGVNLTLSRALPGVVSAALATGVITFFTMYASPFGQTVVPSFASVTTDTHDLSRMSPAAYLELREKWALASVLFTTVLVALPVVMMRQRWLLPAGALAVYFSAVGLFEAAASDLVRWPLALSLLVGAAVAELLHWRRVSNAVLVAGAVAGMWLSYFAVIEAAYGLRWSLELWAGATVLSSGLAALLAAASLPAADARAPHPDLDVVLA